MSALDGYGKGLKCLENHWKRETSPIYIAIGNQYCEHAIKVMQDLHKSCRNKENLPLRLILTNDINVASHRCRSVQNIGGAKFQPDADKKISMPGTKIIRFFNSSLPSAPAGIKNVRPPPISAEIRSCFDPILGGPWPPWPPLFLRLCRYVIYI